MSWFEQFRWTSRTAVCDQLRQFLRTSAPADFHHGWPPTDMPNPERVSDLLADVADETCAHILTALLQDRRVALAFRRDALRALSDLRTILPVHELAALLQDRLLVNNLEQDGWLLAKLLGLFRTEEALPEAHAYLESLTATQRARLFLEIGHSVWDPAPRLVDWLYHRWLRERSQIRNAVYSEYDSAPLDCQIARQTLERPPSRQILYGYWQKAEGESRHNLLHDLWRELGDDLPELVTDPRERAELAQALALPAAELIDRYGAEGLLQQTQQKIRQASNALSQNPRFTLPNQWHCELERALRLLHQWPDERATYWIGSLACCPSLDIRLRGDLLKILWQRDRSQAIRVMSCAAEDAAFMPLARRLLPRMARCPRPQDSEFLQWAIGQTADRVVRYHAVHAMDRLAEHSSEWTRQVEAMTRDPDPYLRVHALGILAHHGDERWMLEIERIAKRARHVCLRAEAVRVLGELEPVKHLELFRRALLEDHEGCGPCPSELPSADEAAAALARAGTAEAMTALIQGYLVVPDYDTPGWISNYLRALMDPDGWREDWPQLFPFHWGRCRNEPSDRWTAPLWLNDEVENGTAEP